MDMPKFFWPPPAEIPTFSSVIPSFLCSAYTIVLFEMFSYQVVLSCHFDHINRHLILVREAKLSFGGSPGLLFTRLSKDAIIFLTDYSII